MTRDEAFSKTNAFMSVVRGMDAPQMWTALSFILGHAMSVTPDDQLPGFMEKLIGLAGAIEDPYESKTIH